MLYSFDFTVILSYCHNLQMDSYEKFNLAVADPGFPVGGAVDLVGGAVDPRGGYVSKILHVKMKESGPVRGGRAPGAPPRSANAWNAVMQIRVVNFIPLKSQMHGYCHSH